MTRQIIVVDVETTGLDPEKHSAVEVAWWNLDTGEHGGYVPPHKVPETLAAADLGALRVNRYIDRIADAVQDEKRVEARRLSEQLKGATLAGSNPAFDAAFIMGPSCPVFAFEKPPWHHRLLDLAAFAAGVLGLDPHGLPGLAKVCEHLGVHPPDHTAAGDVRATGECLYALGAVNRPETT